MTAPVVWRAMESLLVLREQANAIAPSRSKASDGLVGDPAHQATNSDHNPHPVAGVGPAMVTALDLTHDPAHGFDSYRFAETLRTHRDKRIKYVISKGRIFSSYAVGSTPAWTWRPYGGSDPHTNHVHVSVLDNAASDTRTPWNLEGFAGMELSTVVPGTDNPKRTVGDILADLENLRNYLVAAETAALGPGAPNSSSREGLLLSRVAALEGKLNEILTAVNAIGTSTPGAPLVIEVTGGITGTVTGSFSGSNAA